MDTTGQSAKIKREKVEAYVEWDNFELMREIEADRKIARYRELTDLQKAIEEEKKELAKELEPALIASNQKAVRYGDLLLIRASGKTAEKVSPQLLVLKGIDPEVVRECTVGGATYTYIQVKRSGE